MAYFSRANVVQPEWLAAVAIGGYFLFLPFTSNPDISTLILVAFGLMAVYASNTFRPGLGRLDLVLVFALLAAAICSTAMSVEPIRGLRLIAYLCINLLLLLLASSVGSRRRLRFLAGCVGLVGVIHLVAILTAQMLTRTASPSALVGNVPLATLVVPNDALLLGLCLPSLAFFFIAGNGRLNRMAYIALGLYLALSVYVSYLLQSKVALLSVLTAVLALVVSTYWGRYVTALPARRLKAMAGLVVLVLVLSTLAWYLGNQSTTRLSLWYEAITAHSSVTEVLFGSGPNTFLYMPFVTDSGFEKGNLIIPWVHNLYLEAYYEQGLFGATAVILLTVVSLWRSLGIRDPGIRALYTASIVTFCLVALLEISLTRRFYFALFALFYGLSSAHAREFSDE